MSDREDPSEFESMLDAMDANWPLLFLSASLIGAILGTLVFIVTGMQP